MLRGRRVLLEKDPIQATLLDLLRGSGHDGRRRRRYAELAGSEPHCCQLVVLKRPVCLTIAGGTLATTPSSGQVQMSSTQVRCGADVSAPALVQFDFSDPAINAGNIGNGHTLTLSFTSGTSTLAVLAFLQE